MEPRASLNLKGLLSCHRTIEQALFILGSLSRKGGVALTPAQRKAAGEALETLTIGLPAHQAEEQRLVAEFHVPGEWVSARLANDHLQIGRLANEVSERFEHWLAAGTLEGEEAVALAASMEMLQNLKFAHIAFEETIFCQLGI